MNDTENHIDNDHPTDRDDALELELPDVEDVSEIRFERGALTDINYGF